MRELNKQVIQELEVRIAAALATVAQEFGVQLTLKGGTFSKSNALLKLEVATLGEDGEVKSRMAEAFKQNAQFVGLKPEHLGAEFITGGRRFQICGFNPKAVQYPIIAKCVGQAKFNKPSTRDGATFKFSADTVAKLLAVAK